MPPRVQFSATRRLAVASLLALACTAAGAPPTGATETGQTRLGLAKAAAGAADAARNQPQKRRCRTAGKRRLAHRYARRGRKAPASRRRCPAPGARRHRTLPARPGRPKSPSRPVGSTPLRPTPPLQAPAAFVQPPSFPDQPASPARPFSPDSFWNSPLPADAPLDPASATLTGEMRGQVTEYGPWINSVRYSTPVYRVGPEQARMRVALDQDSSRLSQAFESVPVPPDAVPGVGTQAHMVVWQPSTDTMWEFWKMARSEAGWHASWGGRMESVSQNPGHFVEKNWGATATGLPLLGGLVTLDEMRSGRIDHALAVAIPRVRSSVFSWPAQRTDGQVDSPDAIPHGTRFRVDPTLNLDALELPRVTRMLAEAAQRYGIVLRDKAGAVTLYAEDPAPYGIGDPYPALYEGLSPSQIMRRFPWEHLQALKLQMSPG